MVMAYWGIEVDEATLRACCQTDRLGTIAKDAVACARGYGFKAEEIREATWDDLNDWLTEGLYPILLLNLFPLDALWVYHAVIVETITDDRVIYLDPAQGPRTAEASAFEQAWQMNRRRAIIVAPPDPADR
jgi:ABC-type bacteriocin/lantibiotic exporter with double-glycine peptidase domain